MKKSIMILSCVTSVSLTSNAQSFGDIFNRAAQTLGVGTSSSSSQNKNSGTKTTSTTTTNTQPQTQSSGSNTTGKVGISTGSGTTSTTTATNSSQTNSGNSGLGGILGGVVGAVAGGSTGGFTENEAASAIKQALTNGITSGVNIVSLTNGYYGNNLIKIPFPKEVQVVATTLQSIGAGSLIDKLVLQMNRSAEGAAKEALPIFTNAITKMTISDAVNIVSNQQSDAATQFLKRGTYNQLKAAFNPKIKGALDKTGTPAIWNTITNTYNKVPFVKPVNTDLTDYVTGKALDGLFVVVGQQEAKIRKDPAAQTTALLQKVFGKK